MSEQSQPLVSIVTPVYNTEKYLAECIESVLAQTYENWEYVIVNNCSTDRSLEIAQHYAKQDRRIRIHNNEQFLNQMQNWNHTMRQISAESKYCKVVHADDWLFPDCVEAMVALAETNPSVGLVSAYRLDENQVNLDGLPYPSTVLPGRELCRIYLLGGPYVFGSPTSTLIRSDLVRARDSFYNETNIHADEEVCLDLLQTSDFGFVHQVLTFTRRHNETTTTFIRRLETYRLGYFTVLKKYGPVCLSPQEYQAQVRRRLKRYHRYLAVKIFQLKKKEFWDYHRTEMAKLGYPIGPLKLLGAVGLQLLNLRETLGIVRRSLRQRRNKTPQPIRNLKKWDIVDSGA